jgi:hypothetical protein
MEDCYYALLTSPLYQIATRQGELSLQILRASNNREDSFSKHGKPYRPNQRVCQRSLQKIANHSNKRETVTRKE